MAKTMSAFYDIPPWVQQMEKLHRQLEALARPLSFIHEDALMAAALDNPALRQASMLAQSCTPGMIKMIQQEQLLMSKLYPDGIVKALQQQQQLLNDFALLTDLYPKIAEQIPSWTQSLSDTTAFQHEELWLAREQGISRWAETLDRIINGEKGSLTLLFKRPFASAGECRITSLIGGKGSNVVPDTADAFVAFSCNAENMPDYAEDKLTFSSDDGCLHIHADGVSAHAARPQGGENAIGRLLLLLSTLPLAGEQKDAIAFLAEKFGLEVYGEALGLCQHDDISGELTVNLGMISLDNGVLSIHLNIRTPVTANVETIHAQLCSLMTENGFEEAEAKIKAPLYVPSDSVLVQKLSAAFEGMTGEKAYTRTISGGTYAKEMPNVVAFGPNWPGEPPLIHRANEYMELEKLKKHVRITAAAMYELAR